LNDKQSMSRMPHGNDNKQKAVNRSFLSDLIMGLQFYSRLPVGNGKHETPKLSNIAPALAFTSVIIALIPALIIYIGVKIGMPTLFAASLSIGAWVLITGAMSEDAIADSADGLFGGHSIKKRLEIFKDPRHGTYGVTALVLYLGLRIFALEGIAVSSPLAAACLFIALTILSRSSALWLALTLPPARSDGVSASVGSLTKMAFYIGMAFAIILSFIFSAPFIGIVAFFAAIAIIIIINFSWRWLCKKKVNGQTGDLIGALQALLEVGILSIFVVAV